MQYMMYSTALICVGYISSAHAGYSPVVSQRCFFYYCRSLYVFVALLTFTYCFLHSSLIDNVEEGEKFSYTH